MDAQELQQILSGFASLLGDFTGTNPARNRKHFVYRTSHTFGSNVLIGNTITASTTIDRGEDFICVACLVSTRVSTTGIWPGLGSADGAAGAASDLDNPFLIQIGEGSGDRQWHQAAVDANIYSEHGPLGGRLAVPSRLPGGTTLTVNLTNRKQAAAIWQAEVNFIGYKLFASTDAFSISAAG